MSLSSPGGLSSCLEVVGVSLEVLEGLVGSGGFLSDVVSSGG